MYGIVAATAVFWRIKHSLTHARDPFPRKRPGIGGQITACENAKVR